jgi:soluble lytic murein transglycosylase-like protein
MTRLKALLLAAAALALPLSPAAAADMGAAAPGLKGARKPSVLSASERTDYQAVWTAIRSGDWAGANARLDAMGDGPLHAVARAEIYLAKGSPRVELEPLLALIAKAPDMPAAEQLARLAQARGATQLPFVAQPQKLVWQGEQPRRARVRATADPAAAGLEPLVQPLIVQNRPSEAEAHFLAVQDRSPRKLAPNINSVSPGPITSSATTTMPGAWRRSLAAAAANGRCRASGWRRFPPGARAIARLPGTASRGCGARDGSGTECRGHFWAARADMKCRHPERVQTRLRTAARLNETFYGMLAASALGMRQPIGQQLHNYGDLEWQSIARKPNVRAAIALNEIGERSLADQMIAHEARIGGPSEHDALLHLAADLDLAGTQFWLAHNAPRGSRVNVAARYPNPSWQPAQGWRVDKSLAFAHALQESNFRTQVVSPAGAHGLMQVRPGTANDMAKSRGELFEPRQLSDPIVNLEYGQRYMEYLRDYGGTGGLLPKVIAAYNAGPAPVAEWNARAFDKGDPLLYIESIPYWETRGYVPIILRNYWVYEQKEGKDSGTRSALAQGLWPKFPGARGPAAVRLTASEPSQPTSYGASDGSP